MIRRIAVSLFACTLATSAAAQEPNAVEARVISSLDRAFVEPGCKLEGGGDYRVRSGRTYLNTALTGSGNQANRDRAARDGERVVSDAITGAKQDKNPAAWYYLGRLFLQQADLVGADSAFTRAQALAPDCAADIQKYRYRAWAALVNAGAQYRKSEQDDSAMVMLRAADIIYRELPLGYTSMADIFTSSGQNDSAIVYYGKAAATQPTDTVQVKIRNQALYNYGVLQLNAGRHADAIGTFQSYLKLVPDDMPAKKALAQAYRATGRTEEAQELERDLVEAAGAGSVAVVGEGISERDLMEIAVKQFSDKDYGAAATTFSKITELNPWNRDAWFNLANAYLAMEDGPNLAKSAVHLLAIEPLSEYAHSLAAQGYRTAGDTDALFKMIVAREALLANVEMDHLAVTSAEATLTGKATGREARDENNKQLPAKPQIAVVEFLGEGGGVVASAELTIPALKPGESVPLSAEAAGAGISAWRYHLK
ncbi:MAG: tetratricopeptide repeat protein [Gemmatimonadales bacterium]|nr:MAG: tetratricopeptide repeat protein [Gemmatimonadales bacterium]